MSCSRPPSLSDEAISLALDDSAPREVHEHLDHCPACFLRLQEARQLDQTLVSGLRRWDCPPPAQLGDYHLGLIPVPQQREIARHLELCVHCADEIENLRVFLTADDPAPEMPSAASPELDIPLIPHRLRTILARLLETGPGFSLGGIRGGGAGPLIAQCSAATIVLDPLPEDRDLIQIMGQIADETGDQDRWTGALVEARRGGALIAIGVVDDLGSFNFGPLSIGNTDLRVTAEQGLSILLQDLDL